MKGSFSLPYADADEMSSSISFSSSRKGPSSALSEPLRGNGDESEDPFFVFREDMNRKLELVDEGLAEYLRIVHQTVCNQRTSRYNFHTYVAVDSLPSYFRTRP